MRLSLGESALTSPLARARSASWDARSPRMIQACSMVGGAMIPGNPAWRAASSST